MVCSKQNIFGRKNLTYAEFPSKFIWSKDEGIRKIRKQGYSIGRLTYLPHGCGEAYCMRLLLTVQRGSTSYTDIKTVNGKTYDTFKDACFALGLLDDDRESIHAITEASELASGDQLRRLFVSLLVMNSMSNPHTVWESTWRLLSDGILYETGKRLKNPGMNIMFSLL